tara:strand:- start:455 stop:598 length:144 start_codon:yes stop_codon:yes gene_type:complete
LLPHSLRILFVFGLLLTEEHHAPLKLQALAGNVGLLSARYKLTSGID